jgi:hypothetical protein
LALDIYNQAQGLGNGGVRPSQSHGRGNLIGNKETTHRNIENVLAFTMSTIISGDIGKLGDSLKGFPPAYKAYSCGNGKCVTKHIHLSYTSSSSYWLVKPLL